MHLSSNNWYQSNVGGGAQLIAGGALDQAACWSAGVAGALVRGGVAW